MKLISVVFLLCLFFVSLAQAQSQNITDKKFWTINTLLISSTIYDVESTYFAKSRCGKHCKEGNFILRSLVNKGRPVMYTLESSADAVLIYYSYYLKKHDKKLWFFPSVAAAASHVAFGTRNIKFAMRF